MFRLMFGGKKETFKPVKHHAPGSKREQYSNFTLKTLGSGDITGMFQESSTITNFLTQFHRASTGAVKLPPGEELNEWIAANSKQNLV